MCAEPLLILFFIIVLDVKGFNQAVVITAYQSSSLLNVRKVLDLEFISVYMFLLVIGTCKIFLAFVRLI